MTPPIFLTPAEEEIAVAYADWFGKYSTHFAADLRQLLATLDSPRWVRIISHERTP